MTFATLAKRYVFSSAAILFMGTNLSCTSPGEPPSPDNSKLAALQGPAAQPLTLQEVIQLATLDLDPQVRMDAAKVLGWRGNADALSCLALLVTDENVQVRSVAVEAVQSLVHGYHLDPRLATDVLLPALKNEPNLQLKGKLLNGLNKFSSLPTDAVLELQELLRDEDSSIRLFAAAAIAKHLPNGGDVIATAIQATEPHRYTDHLLASHINLCRAEHLPAVRMLASSPDPGARYLADVAIARITGHDEKWLGNAVNKKGLQEYFSAEQRLLTSTWSHIEKETVKNIGAQAQLILFGEAHFMHGPIRKAQIELLRSFAKDPRFDAIGYEPSVMDAQEDVLAVARELGMKLISTEPNWEVLLKQRRPWARDDETAKVINGYLARDPRNRMFVIRGETHTLPGGYLVKQLTETPMIILSVIETPLRFSNGQLQTKGQLQKLDIGEHVYSWSCDPMQFKHLQAWLDKRQLKAKASDR